MSLFVYYLSTSRLSTIFILTCSLLISSTLCKIVATVEAPGKQTSSVNWRFHGFETFNELGSGFYPTYKGTFQLDEYGIKGTYSNLLIYNRDIYGGAWGTGTFSTCYTGSYYELILEETGNEHVNWIGFWISALDPWSRIEFHFHDGTTETWSSQDLVALIGDNPEYGGNPTYPDPRPNSGQAYAYVNFFPDRRVDKIRFIQDAGGGMLETDEHVIGFANSQSGTVIPPETESATTEPETTSTTIQENPVPVGMIVGATAAATAGVAIVAGLVIYGVNSFAGPPAPMMSGAFDLGDEGPTGYEERDVVVGVGGEAYA